MLALKIIGIIAAVIILLMLIPVGAEFEYISGEVKLSALICGFRLKILPKAEGSVKKRREKKSTAEVPDETEKPKKERKPLKLCLSAEEIAGILKKLLKGTGRLNFRPKRFMLHWVAQGDDPYQTAFTFAKVNAVLSSLAPLCAEKYRSCESDVWTDIDFSDEKMQLDAAVSVVIRIGCFFRMLNTIAFGILGIFLRNRCRLAWLKLTDRDYYDYLLERRNPADALIAKLRTPAT